MFETIINLVMWTFNFVIVIMAGIEIVKQYLLQSRNKHVVIDMDSQGNKLIRLEDGREYWVGYPKTLRGFIFVMGVCFFLLCIWTYIGLGLAGFLEIN
ncbi:hypothetical protein Makalu002_088 [Escherichia phage Ec_Makalu_002]|uniref:Uncharacterized protein n=1 Tax=Escherichia phage Ec_Makalu_002 TaxID=2682770 RepID=A0A650DFX0_9CAUD|nr:hypothetical protein Makalu002_088 [Escherichia phage Ec_Makalu_002]